MIFTAPAGARAIGITGLGAYLPERMLGSDELGRSLGVDEEWIVKRSGIRERRLAADGEAASDLALPSARRALDDAGIEPGDIDLVLVATSSPDMLAPATACLLGHELGTTPAPAYDLAAASTGFLYGLGQAYAAVASGLGERVLLTGVEVTSRFLDWRDRDTCILFGDAAASVVIEPVESGGILGFALGSDGSGSTDILVPAGGSRTPVREGGHTIRMNGRNIFRSSTRATVESAEMLLAACGLDAHGVDLYVPHQSNRRIIDHTAERLGIPAEKVVLDLELHGNTSSASIPLALVSAYDAGRLRDGAVVLMTAVGAGLTWGSALLSWNRRSASR